MIHGFLLIDKPKNWTSHDVVGYIRKITGIKKIGHAGTLDPFATGLLVVGVGREATKRLDDFKQLPKTYIATIHLGKVSDTEDSTGNITPYPQTNTHRLTREIIDKTLQTFVGEQNQIPPMFSAKKIQGKKLYELARKGITVERAPNRVTIFSLRCLSFENDVITVEALVSSGTYIRSLARDIGEKLGVGAYCEELQRTKIGDYTVQNATIPEVLERTDFEKNLFITPKTP